MDAASRPAPLASAQPSTRASRPPATIVIPTLGDGGYLDVALGSVVPQARSVGAQVVVVCDGPDAAAARCAQRHGAELITLPHRQGVNAARNAGVSAAGSNLIIFIDKDVEVPQGWLSAYLDGAASAPDRELFGGPIRARLEGRRFPMCGRESAPITTLDHGVMDCDIPRVWGANMAVRRSALDRLGTFDEKLSGRGDEEEWELRLIAAGGRVRYLAAAGVVHRRTARDSRLRVLARAAYRQGREARAHDASRGEAPPLGAELRVLAGCAWHTVRRQCANGILMGATSAGRISGALAERLG